MSNNLPDNWKVKTIEELCEKITDGSHITPKYVVEGVPFLSVKDVTGHTVSFDNCKYITENEHLELTKRWRPEKGDILYTKVGTTGLAKTIDTDRQFSIFVSLALLKPKRDIIRSDYFQYVLNSPMVYQQAQSKTRGMANRNLVLTDIKSIKVPVAPFLEQRRIVAKLDKLFESIDKAIALVEQNIANAQHLMASLLNDAYSELDCERVQILSLVEKQSQINPTLTPTLKFTYIDISSIDKEIQVITDPNSFIGKDAPSRAKKAIRKGDIVFATTRPNLKNIAVVEEDYKNPVASTGLCVLKPIPEKIDNRFLFFYLIGNEIQEQIAPFIRGAQYPAISDKDLFNCTIPLPTLKVQRAITTYLSSMLKKQRALVESQKIRLVELQTLKSSLLDAAFKGDI
jgi:type I restriction enzyme S subunit